jgi:hypothetical protein
MQRERGRHFDPAICDAFLSTVASRPGRAHPDATHEVAYAVVA